MKRNPIRLLFALAFIALSSMAQAATTTYQFDPSHSFVTWHVSHFDFSHPSGKWPITGTLVLDDNKTQNSKVNVTITINQLTTGVPELDAHLKEAAFFDTAQYPNATFVSDKITMIGKKKAKVHGMLTVRGVSKPVTLDVTLNKMDVNPITEKQTVGFSGKTTLKRSEFGISTLTPNVSDEVKIDIEAEAQKIG